MMNRKKSGIGPTFLLLSLLWISGLERPLLGQWSYPPDFPEAVTEIYKTVGPTELKAWLFRPPDLQETDARPAIVFFFGGGWSGGTPAQFGEHCAYLADRGMVAVTVDYRVRKRQDARIPDCVADARDAIRWLRANAVRFSIDPNRIVAAGGSAGGHLAAATALLADPDNDNALPSTNDAAPNALALFNPVLVLADIPGKFTLEGTWAGGLRERAGVELSTVSPYHYIRPGIGPTIIFHGTGDKTVPYATIELFREAMQAAGNRCELVGYQEAGHGFFNFRRNGNGAYIDTVNRLDAFLVSLGYIPAPPALVEGH